MTLESGPCGAHTATQVAGEAGFAQRLVVAFTHVGGKGRTTPHYLAAQVALHGLLHMHMSSAINGIVLHCSWGQTYYIEK